MRGSAFLVFGLALSRRGPLGADTAHACSARRDPTGRLLFLTGVTGSVLTLLVAGPLPHRRLPARGTAIEPDPTFARSQNPDALALLRPRFYVSGTPRTTCQTEGSTNNATCPKGATPDRSGRPRGLTPVTSGFYLFRPLPHRFIPFRAVVWYTKLG
eukprot:4612842-Prymnesium_polylepis.1